MHPLPGTPTFRSCGHEQPGGPCAECRAADAARAAAAPPAPVAPPLGRVALGSPADAAALAVIRGLLADDRIRRSLEHDAREWSAAVEGHEFRAGQQPEGSAARAAQDERAREARQHRDLYRAVLALHVPSVAHDESVDGKPSPEEAPR